MRQLLSRLNGAWLRCERAFVVVGLLVMACVVTADVMHRKMADPAWQTPGKWAAVLAVGFLLVAAAVRAAPNLKWGRLARWVLSLVLTLALAGAARGLAALFPSGLIWSQRVALILMLWVAFFGASIATYENRHLRVEAAERLFPPRIRRAVGAIANGLAAVATGLLAWLSGRYCAFLYDEFASTGGIAGSFDEIAVPQYAAYAILPLALTVMSLRFAGHMIAPPAAPPKEGGA